MAQSRPFGGGLKSRLQTEMNRNHRFIKTKGGIKEAKSNSFEGVSF